MELTPEQRAAIERTGQDVCTVAGPGSGKTRVLVERFCWLVEQGCSPARILAITFTEKAAHEIKRRLAERFRDPLETRRAIERAWVSTVHGYCARLLRENALEAGLDPRFAILEERIANAELEAAIRESLDGMTLERPDRMRALFTVWKAADPAGVVAEVYEAKRLAGALTIVEQHDGHDAERAALAELLARVDGAYQSRKRRRSALDFADLEEKAIELLERDPALAAALRNGFDAVLMDELQDTNPLQWRLIDLIRRPGRFFAVGDINQSIFGFRHAEPAVFGKYRERIERQGEVVDRLASNFRSRAEILDAATAILGSAPGIEAPELKPARVFRPKAEPSIEVLIAAAEDAGQRAQIEAQSVARRIRELEGRLMIDDRSAVRPARFSDMAVLVRNSNSLGPFEEAFRLFGVPYLMTRGKTFFEEQEICDLTNWLRVLDNPRDEIALAAVLRSPLGGVSDEALWRLREDERNLADSVRASAQHHPILWADDAARLAAFSARLDNQRAQRDEAPLDLLLGRAIDDSGYAAGLDANQRANIDKFLALVRDWAREGPRPITELIRLLDQMRVAGEEPEAPINESTNAVSVLTMHTAKGLEFPVVFLVALHRGIHNDRPALSFSPDTGLGVLWRNPRDGKGVPDPAHARYLKAAKAKEAHEADRLLYVAMTRAEEHLVLSWCETNTARCPWPAMIGPALPVIQARVTRLEGPPPVWEDQGSGETRVPEPLVLAKPAITGQHDSTVPVSAIVQFRNCPRQYFLERYLGWTGRERTRVEASDDDATEARHNDELGAGEFGQQVHALLAGESVENPVPEALDLALRFRQSALGRRAGAATRREQEFDFMIEVEGIVLRGQIDLWFEESGELVLVDYKTDDIDPAAEPERVASYALQLQLYSLALERATGRRPDHAAIHFLRPDEVVEVQPDEAGARAAVLAFLAAQQDLAFPLKEGRQCLRCAFYRGLCPARQPVERAAAAVSAAWPQFSSAARP